MRKTRKALVTLGLAAMMLVSTITTAFAYEHTVITEKESVMTIGGQKPTLTSGYTDDLVTKMEVYQYNVYLMGRDTLTASDIQIEGDWNIEVWDYSTDYDGVCYAWPGQSFKVPEFNGYDREISFELSKKVDDTLIRITYNFMSNPSGGEIESYGLQNLIDLDAHTMTGATVETYLPVLGTNYYVKDGDTTGTLLTYNWDTGVFTAVGKNLDMSKVKINKDYDGKNSSIIKVDGNTFTENDEAFTTTTSNTVTDKGAGFWASNDKGWWIQYNDGSYLTNAWYQSPASGLWYYMGADGYMLTDTTTPDGYYVNADGVWVEKRTAEADKVSDIQQTEETARTEADIEKEVTEHKYTWNFTDSYSGENIQIGFDSEVPMEGHRRVGIMISAWIVNDLYGEDFWDVELKAGRTGDVYPAFGAYVYPDDFYHAVKDYMMTNYPHDSSKTKPYDGLYGTEPIEYYRSYGNIPFKYVYSGLYNKEYKE